MSKQPATRQYSVDLNVAAGRLLLHPFTVGIRIAASSRDARNGRFTRRKRLLLYAATAIARLFPSRKNAGNAAGTRRTLRGPTRSESRGWNRAHAIWRLRLATTSGISTLLEMWPSG
jgi:hypothetical protein